MAFRRASEFTWKPIENIAQGSISNTNTGAGLAPSPPPVDNNFLLLNGSPFLLLNGSNFSLLG